MDTKISKLTEQIAAQIKNGEFGPSGEYFISTRKLSETYDVSIDSACKIMVGLREKRVITLQGKHSYITTGYAAPHTPYGKQLSKTRGQILGMIVNRIDNPFFASVAIELNRAASEQGYQLLIANSNYRTERELQLVDEFVRMGTSGLFVCPSSEAVDTGLYASCPLPIVSLGRYCGPADCDTVLVNNYAAGKQVADHLHKIGCKTYVYVGLKNNANIDPRWKGFRDQLAMYGVDSASIHVVTVDQTKEGRTDVDSISGEIQHLLWSTSGKEKIGIFCYHDLLASGLIQMVRRFSQSNRAKYRIPEDIAVVGFDDLPQATLSTPPLTTVSYSYGSIADIAMRAMKDYLTNPHHVPRVYETLSSLIVRGSTVTRE